MHRSLVPLLAATVAATCAACTAASDEDEAVATATAALEAGSGAGWVVDVERTQLAGDVYHHAFTLVIGDTPNARLRLHRVVRERAPWRPRTTRGGVMLLHGDFSSFGSNFAPITLDPAASPGLAVWLAQRDFDVWGVDRRWALAPADADLSDFDGMGVVQELADVDRALAAARAVRLVTGAGADRLHLAGFSRGGLLAYAAAAADGARPPWARQLRGLVALDVWAAIPPEDVDARAGACLSSSLEYQDLAAGIVDSPNEFFQIMGSLALSDPDGQSPLFRRFTNRGLFLLTAAQTYVFFAPTATYHLAAGQLVDDTPTHLTESPEPVIANWFATATSHQSLREAADTDAIWCGDGSAPLALDLSRITVPLLYLGAAGGYGDHGLYSTTLVGSHDVTTRVIRRQPPGGEAEDFGHGDLLFGHDAVALAWEPLASWLAAR